MALLYRDVLFDASGFRKADYKVGVVPVDTDLPTEFYGINKMSPQDVIDGIDKYSAGGRKAYSTEAADRRAFRNQAWNDAFDSAFDATGG